MCIKILSSKVNYLGHIWRTTYKNINTDHQNIAGNYYGFFFVIKTVVLNQDRKLQIRMDRVSFVQEGISSNRKYVNTPEA